MVVDACKTDVNVATNVSTVCLIHGTNHTRNKYHSFTSKPFSKEVTVYQRQQYVPFQVLWTILGDSARDLTNTYCNYNEYPSPLHPDPPENLFYVPKSLTTKDKKIIVFLRTTTLTQKTLLHDRCQHGNRLFALTNFFDVFNEQSGNIFVQESLIPQDEGLRICVGVFGWNMSEFSQFDRVRRHTE